MTRRIHAVAALALLLLATACGKANTTNSGGSNTEVLSAVVSQPPSHLEAPPLALNEATPDPSVVDLREVHWDRTIAGPDPKLVIQYTASGRADCAKLGRVDVTETDQTVTVKLFLGRLPGVDCSGPQPMIAASFQTTVALKAPVGLRPIK